jgi:predicted transcriptional regulator
MNSAALLRQIRKGLNLTREEMRTVVKLSPQSYARAEAGMEAVPLGWWPVISRWIAEHRGSVPPIFHSRQKKTG